MHDDDGDRTGPYHDLPADLLATLRDPRVRLPGESAVMEKVYTWTMLPWPDGVYRSASSDTPSSDTPSGAFPRTHPTIEGEDR